MSVSTYAEHPWVANVYFVHDDELNLYFVSKATTEHCKAIEKNNMVAVAIADSAQPLGKTQKGIQLYGTAKAVNAVEKLGWMFTMWNKLIAHHKDDMMFNPEQFLQAGFARVYKITPHRIRFFNTELNPKSQLLTLQQL